VNTRRRRALASLLHSSAGVRLVMAASLPRLMRRRGRATSALRRTMKSIALGRIPSDERAWARRIEDHRHELFARSTPVEPFVEGYPEDLGWASRIVSMPPVWCGFLIRLVRELAPNLGIELGTGVGISTAYQAAGLALGGGGRLMTFDGSADWVRVAEQGLERLELAERVDAHVGPIAETVPRAANGSGRAEYALVDAEHTEEATLADFRTILPHLAHGAVVVFDDIPWTPGMRRAWRTVARSERVSVALALGRMGVVVVGNDHDAQTPQSK
jgi:predicted O-methyltransferase YrrM